MALISFQPINSIERNTTIILEHVMVLLKHFWYRKMAELVGPTSNSLFQVLEEWERYLKSEDVDIHIPIEVHGKDDGSIQTSKFARTISDTQKAKPSRSIRRSRGPSL